MKAVKVTYTVKAGFVPKNLENVNQFVNDLKKLNHPGIRYSVFLGEDGKTFVHLAIFDNDASQQELFKLESFQSFQRQRDESGLEIPPAIEELQYAASSFSVFN